MSAGITTGIEIGCPFCEECQTVLFTVEGFRHGVAGYVAHLVESHWDKLEEGRAMCQATGL